MIGIVAKIRVKEGQGPQFENVAKQLVEAVNANEPDCLLYALHRVQEDENLYVFMEQYKDQAATEFHRKQDHFRTLGRAMGEFMDGPVEIMRLDGV